MYMIENFDCRVLFFADMFYIIYRFIKFLIFPNEGMARFCGKITWLIFANVLLFTLEQ